jgi:hypothetical protein
MLRFSVFTDAPFSSNRHTKSSSVIPAVGESVNYALHLAQHLSSHDGNDANMNLFHHKRHLQFSEMPTASTLMAAAVEEAFPDAQLEVAPPDAHRWRRRSSEVDIWSTMTTPEALSAVVRSPLPTPF